jgi:mRNA interferase RelE/StbE
MAWQIEFTPKARRALDRLDRQIARRILKFLSQRLAASADPRTLGQALRGDELGDFWKYRVGDYRIIADVVDRKVTIYVVNIGHRSEIYRLR